MPLFRFVLVGIAKTLSKVFGLATIAFFGRMPSRDDDQMALVGLLSISWLPVLVAIPIPAFAETIIPFAPDDDAALRAIAVTIAVAIPFLVGWVVSRLHNHDGTSGAHTVRELFRGWWYTPVIGLTVTALILVVPLVKFSHLARRYDIQRMMVMIPRERYDDVVEHLCAVLRHRGLEVSHHRPNRVMGALFGALGYVLGRIFRRDVAQRLRVVRGTDADGGSFELTVHAADLTVIGRQKQVARVHAVLAEGIDEREVYFTWDDASQDLEDRMRGYRDALEDGEEVDPDALNELSEELATLELDQEEWNAVRRNLYRLERDAARAALDARDDAATVGR
ncbi:hypothetical protein FTX61_13800 [Nitriliruptoraceae bacterium ZYF776]|nr:hypothetical protein [Profundirhabdus halotolerans]